MSAGAARAPAEKTPLAANAEPVAAKLRKSRLDDVVMVRSLCATAESLKAMAQMPCFR
jgi:hypothetical protein